MAPDRFSHSTTTPSPRSAVWSALDKPETWEAVAGVDRVREPVFDVDGRLRGFVFDTVVAGRAYAGRATPRDRDEGRLIAWDIENSQVTGAITVLLEDAEEGTSIDVSVEMRPVSMMSRMFFGAIARTVQEGLPRTVEEMAKRF